MATIDRYREFLGRCYLSLDRGLLIIIFRVAVPRPCKMSDAESDSRGWSFMRLPAGFAMFAVVSCSRTRASSAPATPFAPAVVAIESINPGTVVGIVENSTGTPLAQAVLLLDSRATIRVDSTGRFRFAAVPAGTHRLRAMAIGFIGSTHRFTLSEGSATAVVFRLTADTKPPVEVCTTELRASVIVRLPNVAGAIVTVAHKDSVERYALDTLYDKPDKDGMRTVPAFWEVAGRFDVTVTATGYRTWRAKVSVPQEKCHHVTTQVVTARLVPQK